LGAGQGWSRIFSHSFCFFTEKHNMSKCNFSLDFTGSPDQVYARAKAAVEKQGGSFTGDASSGQFSINVFGTISGRYAVVGQQLQITIEDKPMMIPCAAIENALKSGIGG
jgi:hypothetical protein